MLTFGFFLLNIAIALFTFFLILVYVISDLFKSMPFYFNIFFCIVISLDNAIRLIPVEDEKVEDPSIWCRVQGFSLSFFDKLFLTSITIYSIINCIIMILPKLYEKKMKLIYIILILLNICFSLGLTILFYQQGMSDTSMDHKFCYINTKESIKITVDTIYTIILFLIDVICITCILIKICKLMKKWDEKRNESKRKLCNHFWRFLVDLFINIITFGYLFLLINGMLPFNEAIVKDFIYIILGLITELFFTINDEFIKEAMRIITCNKCDKFKKKDENVERLNSGEIEINESLNNIEN
jgi:hypothetical protein